MMIIGARRVLNSKFENYYRKKTSGTSRERASDRWPHGGVVVITKSNPVLCEPSLCETT